MNMDQFGQYIKKVILPKAIYRFNSIFHRNQKDNFQLHMETLKKKKKKNKTKNKKTKKTKNPT